MTSSPSSTPSTEGKLDIGLLLRGRRMTGAQPWRRVVFTTSFSLRPRAWIGLAGTQVCQATITPITLHCQRDVKAINMYELPQYMFPLLRSG